MLELQRKKLPVKLDGVVYELSYAKVSQLKEIASAKKEDAVDMTIDFIVKAGMPKEVVENLEADHINAIVEALTGAKKN